MNGGSNQTIAPANQSETPTSPLLLILSVMPSQLRHGFAGLFLLVVVTAATNTLGPLLYKNLVDKLEHAELSVTSVMLCASAFGAGRALIASKWMLYGHLEQRVVRRLTLFLFDRIHDLAFSFHTAKATADLQQIVSNGVSGFRIIAANIFNVLLPLLLNISFMALALAVLYPPTLVAIVFAMIALYVCTLIWGTRTQRRHYRQAEAAYVEASTRASDSYLNYEAVQLFDAKFAVRRNVDAHLKISEAGFRRFFRSRSFTGLVQAVWFLLGLAAAFLLTGSYVYSGSMTIGDFVLIGFYILQIWGPLEFLGAAYRDIQIGLTNLERVVAVNTAPSQLEDPPDALPAPNGPVAVELNGVTFSYEAKTVLRDVSIKLMPGKTTALLGPTGSGKSTLARLIFRFYEPQCGQIIFNGLPTSAIQSKSLRSAMAFVPQDILLFNDSIRNNIAIGRDDCDRTAIENAAKLAELHDFIMSLPAGYDTKVGERGAKLSGGQRQRIAIARAILKQPRLLVLDEGTSALDSKTERVIQTNLQQLGITTLIITHRLAAIRDADQIIVLLKGAVVESGPHDSLLASQGIYASMWKDQQSSSSDSQTM